MSKRPRGIKTNGKGQRTTAHLNLLRSMADVVRDEEAAAARIAAQGSQAKRIIADGYAKGLSKYEIAQAAGISPESVKVIACRIGLKRPKKTFAPQPKAPPAYAGHDRTEPRWGKKHKNSMEAAGL